jgi:hypothetical protein
MLKNRNFKLKTSEFYLKGFLQTLSGVGSTQRNKTRRVSSYCSTRGSTSTRCRCPLQRHSTCWESATGPPSSFKERTLQSTFLRCLALYSIIVYSLISTSLTRLKHVCSRSRTREPKLLSVTLTSGSNKLSLTRMNKN